MSKQENKMAADDARSLSQQREVLAYSYWAAEQVAGGKRLNTLSREEAHELKTYLKDDAQLAEAVAAGNALAEAVQRYRQDNPDWKKQRITFSLQKRLPIEFDAIVDSVGKNLTEAVALHRGMKPEAYIAALANVIRYDDSLNRRVRELWELSGRPEAKQNPSAFQSRR